MSSDKKLKIIHTEASPHWGGQEIRIFEEMKWFREQGHEMILVAPVNGTLYMRCKEEGFQVISVYFTKPRTLLNILKMLLIIWRLKPDIVGTHSSTDSWAGLTASYLLRVGKRIRYRHVSTKVKKNFLNGLQYNYLTNLIITTGDCISAPISDSFDLKPNTIHTIPTGISLNEKIPDKECCRKLLLDELNLSDEVRFIGQVSVLRSWKGLEELIDAYKIVSKNIDSLHLVIVGEGPPMRKVLEDKIARETLSATVHLVGHKENPLPYMKAFDAAILSSLRNEGIPQALLRAMSLGSCVIGTRVGGIPEIITHEVTGLLAEPGDGQSLAEQIKKGLENHELAKRLGEKAELYVKENFNWDMLGARLLNLMSE
jgi:glycosyltransferase involved in cell wall biosynthesis